MKERAIEAYQVSLAAPGSVGAAIACQSERKVSEQTDRSHADVSPLQSDAVEILMVGSGAPPPSTASRNGRSKNGLELGAAVISGDGLPPTIGADRDRRAQTSMTAAMNMAAVAAAAAHGVSDRIVRVPVP